MYNNINQDTAKTHLVHFHFWKLSTEETEETEEKKRFQETE